MLGPKVHLVKVELGIGLQWADLTRPVDGPAIPTGASGRFSYNKNASNSPESIGFYNLNNTTFSTTISNTLDVTVQWNSADPLNSIYTDMFNLYRIF